MISIFRLFTLRGLHVAALFFCLAWPATADQWVVSEAGGFYPKRPPQLALAADGTPVVAYYDGEGGILVRRKGQEPARLNVSPQAGKPSGLALAAAGGNLVAVWRERRKQGQILVIRRSADGGSTWDPVTVIDSATEPLTRIQIAGEAGGRLYLLWLGRRLDEEPEPMPVEPGEGDAPGDTQPRHSYHIYASHSDNGGESWSAPSKLTEGYADSIWPTLAVTGDRGYSFTSSIKEGKRHILVRWSDGENGWSEPVRIKEVGTVMLMRATPLRDGIMVQWLASYPGHYLLEGAISRDRGKSWQSFAIEETKALDIANLETAVQGDHINTIFSARQRKSAGSRKQTIYLLHSDNGGLDWEKPRILRQEPHSLTQALYPRITGDGKSVVAVWNDFRNFRGNLYSNHSTDGGKSWQREDVPLEPPGRRNSYLFPFSQSFVQHQDRYDLLAGRYADDRFSAAVELVLVQFQPQTVRPESNPADDPGPGDKAAALRKRVGEFWQALMENDYKTTYGLFDPFFRGRYREVDYLAATGMVKYHGFEIEDVQVVGNMGRVTLSYKYEIPTVSTRLGTLTRPPTEVKVGETWLFIDGDWFKEYRNETSGTVFGRY